LVDGFRRLSRCLHAGSAAAALKAGIVAADGLSTVSPSYAREIQTPEQGYGLDWLMRARSDRLAGITNGVDYDIWNPETDPISQRTFRLTIFRVSANATGFASSLQPARGT